MVLLPEPVRPTIASDPPASTEKLTSSTTARSPYLNERCSTRTAPRTAAGSGSAPLFTSGTASKITRRRS